MNLLYLAGSLIGIALLVGLAFILFGRGEARLAQARDVEGCLSKQVPGFVLGACAIAKSAAAALAQDSNDGAIYLIVAFGGRLVVRRLDAGLLKRVVLSGSVLTLTLRDFTLGKAVLDLGAPDEASSWKDNLTKIPG